MNYQDDARSQPDTSLDHTTNPSAGTSFTSSQKKRKRESIDSSKVSQWFDAKLISSDRTHALPTVSFSPVETILRAHLPLAWLSSEAQTGILAPGQILQANIQSISRWDYSILVVRHLPNGGLYAVERVDIETYVCFPLRDFVTIEWIRQAAIGATPTLDTSLLRTESRLPHRRSTSLTCNSGFQGIKDEHGSPKQAKNRRGMLARQSILSKQTNLTADVADHPIVQSEEQGAGESTFADIFDDSAIASQQGNLKEQQEPVALNHDITVCDLVSNELAEPIAPTGSKASEAVQTLGDQLSPDYLRKRYLEMLYLSKTSLAFYAKGPLSRTRARARASGASMNLGNLATFYRDSILPVKKLDLKYKQSLQTKIASLNSIQRVEANGREQSSANLSRPISRKSRRTKLGKDALWPIEDDFIEKWWSNMETTRPTRSGSDSVESGLERQIPSLRMREIELQVILILEVLALERQETSMQPDLEAASTNLNEESTETTAVGKSPNVVSSGKKRDLKLDLEVLLDRLCILHSIGYEELMPGQAKDDIEQSMSGGTRDDLKDFCKDVIIPFYSSKLPDECKQACKKLGGLNMSPSRPPATEAKNRPVPLPGAAIASRTLAVSKRMSKSVLAEEHTQRNVLPPTLSRSSTLPSSTNIKRESSERPMSRGGVQKSLSFSNREIDLVADAQATAAKRRKLERITAQKRELEAAINALKKPNRSIAAKTFMDDVERRNAEQKPPSRKNDPVQITATPKITRTKSVSMDDYELPPMPGPTARPDMAYVPSSTVKPRGLSHISSMAKTSVKKRAVLAAIQDTPSRHQGPDPVGADPETESAACSNSRLLHQSSSTLVNSTPAPSRLRPDLIQTILSTPTQVEKRQKVQLFTPIKRTHGNMEDMFKDVPEIQTRASQIMDRVMKVDSEHVEHSIYDTLGWNDDDDDCCV